MQSQNSPATVKSGVEEKDHDENACSHSRILGRGEAGREDGPQSEDDNHAASTAKRHGTTPDAIEVEGCPQGDGKIPELETAVQAGLLVAACDANGFQDGHEIVADQTVAAPLREEALEVADECPLAVSGRTEELSPAALAELLLQSNCLLDLQVLCCNEFSQYAVSVIFFEDLKSFFVSVFVDEIAR